MVAAIERVSAALLVLAGLMPTPAWAGEFRVDVVDGNGQSLAGAVASLHSVAAATATVPRPAKMDQRDSQFAPRLLLVQVGSEVSFPNSDNIHHHVYSFSPAKPFELPLYSGQPASPVRFDVPGVVALGCNIHDWMVGHILVLDTPYFATSGKDGRAKLQAPAGNYNLQVWHPALQQGDHPVRQPVTLSAMAGAKQVRLAVEAATASSRPAGDPRLQKLQEKLRSLKK